MNPVCRCSAPLQEGKSTVIIITINTASILTPGAKPAQVIKGPGNAGGRRGRAHVSLGSLSEVTPLLLANMLPTPDKCWVPGPKQWQCS
ncbi:unnamed protein product [Lota lota]